LKKGLQHCRSRALVILGANDTTSGVTVDTAVAAIREHSAAEVVVIQGQGHHVQNSPDAVAKAADWLRKFLERN
jgi:pimeloyl-ACP methyl ester carboxylesterase